MTKITNWAIARLKDDTFEFISINERTLLARTVYKFDEASQYDNQERAKSIASLQKQLSDMLGSGYEYIVVKRDTEYIHYDLNDEVIKDEEPTE